MFGVERKLRRGSLRSAKILLVVAEVVEKHALKVVILC